MFQLNLKTKNKAELGMLISREETRQLVVQSVASVVPLLGTLGCCFADS